MTTTVGKFSMDASGVVTGPAGYMRERFAAFRAELEAGRSSVFNYGAANNLGTTSHLVLVAIQTDYAAWLGMKALCG